MTAKNPVRLYAEQLMEKTGCSKDAYRLAPIEEAMKDLQDYAEANHVVHPFSIDEIAFELKQISEDNYHPEPPKKYVAIFDTDDTCDALCHTDDFDEAVNACLDCYAGWAVDMANECFCRIHRGEDKESVWEDWVMMIENCTCYVALAEEMTLEPKYPDESEYYLSDEELKSVGWIAYPDADAFIGFLFGTNGLGKETV